MSSIFFRLVGFATMLAGVKAYAGTNVGAPPGWRLVWNDEFNQPDGSAPNPVKWSYDTGGLGWGNKELQYYTLRTNNSRIENGELIIEARREEFDGRHYTSARLLTLGKASWTYGRVEARIKIPRGQGVWPTFWMLGTNIASVNWPTCGEVDIMENRGREPGTVHGTAHGPGYASLGIGNSLTLPAGAAMADDFHVFAVECEPDRITWFLDGRQYFVLTPASLPEKAVWVFNQPKFLILNLAVGGIWPGDPDATSTFPQRMLVDYVRVYEKLAPSENQPELGRHESGVSSQSKAPSQMGMGETQSR